MKSWVDFQKQIQGVRVAVGNLQNFPLPKFLHDFSIPESQTVLMEQVHGDQIAVIDQMQSNRVAGVDALLTKNPQIHLVVRTADCVPILLAEESGWVGVIHAGRKGTQVQILFKTLQRLKEQGGDLAQTFLFLGPAISVKNYEINPTTHEHFDLESENTKQAQAAGVPAQNIFKAGICTLEDTSYPSYRRNGTQQRFFSAIWRETHAKI